MHELALDLGFFCTPRTPFLIDLATRITAAIRQRSAGQVYQSAALSLSNFPLEFAREIFALASQDFATPAGTTTWRLESMDQISQVFGSIFEAASPYCTGASKAFKSSSAPVIRVFATVMSGAVISHVVHSRGVSKMYVNFMYALLDENGELHPPKDSARNEIALTPEEVHEIRTQVASDALALGEMGMPLSAGWWRQLNNETEAKMTEAMVQNVTTAPVPAPGKRRRAAGHYEIEAIVEEKRGWYLVRWAGCVPNPLSPPHS